MAKMTKKHAPLNRRPLYNKFKKMQYSSSKRFSVKPDTLESMIRRSCVFFLTILVLAPLSARASTLEVSGWIPYWRAATGTADVMPHLGGLTEINPFVFRMKADGTVANPDAMDSEPWLSFVAQARLQKVRVIPTVMWSDGNAIHTVLSNSKKRIALEDALADLVHAKAFDGIDIDFEGKKAETRPYFSLFLKGLYQRVGKQWLMCTIEARTPVSSRYTKTPPKDATVYANDYAAIAKYCDRVRIMAYDQGATDVKLNAAALGPYIPNADPLWVEKVIPLAAQSIPKKKLVVGIPTYGSEYDVEPYDNGGYAYSRLWSFNPRYATELATSLGVPPTRNQAGELSFVYTPKNTVTTPSGVEVDPTTGSVAPTGTEQTSGRGSFSTTTPFRILWWSDAQAIADKVALAKRLGVRGVALFKFDGGEDPNMWSVLPLK